MVNQRKSPADRAAELALFAVQLARDNHHTITSPFQRACACLPPETLETQFPNGKTFAELLDDIQSDLVAYDLAIDWLKAQQGEPSD